RYDHDRVRRADHHQVLDAHQGGQPFVGMDDTVSSIHGHDLALHDVAVQVRLGDVEQRVPAADVGPGEIADHHRGTVSLFHYGIINGFLRRARKGFRLQAYEPKIVAGICDRRLDRDGHVGFEHA